MLTPFSGCSRSCLSNGMMTNGKYERKCVRVSRLTRCFSKEVTKYLIMFTQKVFWYSKHYNVVNLAGWHNATQDATHFLDSWFIFTLSHLKLISTTMIYKSSLERREYILDLAEKANLAVEKIYTRPLNLFP